MAKLLQVVRPTVIPPIEKVILELMPEEALAIKIILGKIPGTGVGFWTEKIYDALPNYKDNKFLSTDNYFETCRVYPQIIDKKQFSQDAQDWLNSK